MICNDFPGESVSEIIEVSKRNKVQRQLKFRKFKLAFDSIYRLNKKKKNLGKLCVLSCELKFDNKKIGITRLVFELSALKALKALKAKIKGVFSSSYSCYGNFLLHFDVLRDQLVNRRTAT